MTPGSPKSMDSAIKRIVDLAGSGLGLLVLAPLFAVAAVAIKLDSRGPVFFRQERIGRDERRFRVWKFRTMQVGASDALHRAYIAELASGAADHQEGLKKLTSDPRVTRVGRVLRATSIDELPQLINVFAGEMSLVGPRPALEYELEHYRPEHYDRFRVKPGMTGLWQVSGRAELGFNEMLDLDVQYAQECGPLADLRILLKTPGALLGRTA